MEGKCPYCANTKGVLFEKANAETDSPLVGRCEHCRRILGFTPDVKSMMHILEEKLRIDRPNNG